MLLRQSKSNVVLLKKNYLFFLKHNAVPLSLQGWSPLYQLFLVYFFAMVFCAVQLLHLFLCINWKFREHLPKQANSLNKEMLVGILALELKFYFSSACSVHCFY